MHKCITFNCPKLYQMSMKLLNLPDLDSVKHELKGSMTSQLALARLSGVSQSVISRITEGKIRDPSYSTVVKLLYALNRLNNPHGNIIIQNRKSKTAKDIMNKNVVSVKRNDTLEHVWNIMKSRGYSQIPVVDDRNRMIGSISEAL